MSTIVMAKQSKPYYGEKTKQKIVEDYSQNSITLKKEIPNFQVKVRDDSCFLY